MATTDAPLKRPYLVQLMGCGSTRPILQGARAVDTASSFRSIFSELCSTEAWSEYELIRVELLSSLKTEHPPFSVSSLDGVADDEIKSVSDLAEVPVKAIRFQVVKPEQFAAAGSGAIAAAAAVANPGDAEPQEDTDSGNDVQVCQNLPGQVDPNRFVQNLCSSDEDEDGMDEGGDTVPAVPAGSIPDVPENSNKQMPPEPAADIVFDDGDGSAYEEESESEEEEEQKEPNPTEDDVAVEHFVPDEVMTPGEKRKRREEEVKARKLVKKEQTQERQRAKRIEGSKIAALIGYEEVFNRKPEAAQDVDDNVLRRIRKALNLGMHGDTPGHEQNQAMNVATKLMRQYGLSKAEVEKTGKSDIEEAAGVVSVRLRGRYRTWPKWGRDLLWVANDMANTLSFWRRPTVYDKKKVEDSMKVFFYGMQADAKFAAYVFETAYNIVQERGELEYGEKGQTNDKRDYRDGLAHGLHNISKQDRRNRDKEIEDAKSEKDLARREAADKAAATRAADAKASEAKRAAADEKEASEKRKVAAVEAAAWRAAADKVAKRSVEVKAASEAAAKEELAAKAASVKAAETLAKAAKALEAKFAKMRADQAADPTQKWVPAHWKEEDDKKVAEKEAKGQQKKAQEAAHAAEAKRTSAKKAEEELAAAKAAVEQAEADEARRAAEAEEKAAAKQVKEDEANVACEALAEKVKGIEARQRDSQQLVLFSEKQEKVREAVKTVVQKELNNKTEKRRAPRVAKNQKIFERGEQHAADVSKGLGAKTIEAPNAYQGKNNASGTNGIGSKPVKVKKEPGTKKAKMSKPTVKVEVKKEVKVEKEDV